MCRGVTLLYGCPMPYSQKYYVGSKGDVAKPVIGQFQITKSVSLPDFHSKHYLPCNMSSFFDSELKIKSIVPSHDHMSLLYAVTMSIYHADLRVETQPVKKRGIRASINRFKSSESVQRFTSKDLLGGCGISLSRERYGLDALKSIAEKTSALSFSTVSAFSTHSEVFTYVGG